LVGVVDTVADEASETGTTQTADNHANEGEHDAESEPSDN
jgi:molecular chaperone GrpE